MDNDTLRTCSPKDIEAIRRAGTEVTVPAGTVIRPNAPRAHWTYVVLDGLAFENSHGELIAETRARVLVIDRRHELAAKVVA